MSGDDVSPGRLWAASGTSQDRSRVQRLSLREEWRVNACDWIAWARAPMHDSYWRFHRQQFLELLPSPGRLTVDIGAGEGRVSRDLNALGHRVVALDMAEAMVVAAREAEPGIGVLVADAASLPIRDGAADLVVAFMSLHDMEDLQGSLREMARVLEPGGRLCCAIVHPLNSAGEFDSDDPHARFIIKGSYLQSGSYVDEMERDGLRMRFVSEHRPLQSYFEALRSAGFLIERLREPAVPDEAARAPRDHRWQRLPLFLHLVAIRI